jgi:hypothetical protein
VTHTPVLENRYAASCQAVNPAPSLTRMNLRRPTPNKLVAQDTAAWSRAIGVGLAALGLIVLFATATGRYPHPWSGVMAGTILTALGTLIWRAIAAQMVTLDRTAGLVELRTQHILGSAAVVHRLADVADVVLDRRPIGHDRDVYRTAFVMRDGTHRAWGAQALNNSRPDQIATVHAMREFLGTAGSLTAPDGTVAIPRPSTYPVGWAALPPQKRRVAAAMLVFTLVLSATLCASGVWLVWTQHQLLTAYVTATATVQSTDVVTTRDEKGQVTTRPAVRYAYRVDGRAYSSDEVTPLNESRSGNWAQGVAASYHSGQVVTVYYDPANPGHAYLERTWSVLPWLFVAGPLVFLILGGISAREAFRGRANAPRDDTVAVDAAA